MLWWLALVRQSALSPLVPSLLVSVGKSDMTEIKCAPLNTSNAPHTPSITSQSDINHQQKSRCNHTVAILHPSLAKLISPFSLFCLLLLSHLPPHEGMMTAFFRLQFQIMSKVWSQAAPVRCSWSLPRPCVKKRLPLALHTLRGTFEFFMNQEVCCSPE